MLEAVARRRPSSSSPETPVLTVAGRHNAGDAMRRDDASTAINQPLWNILRPLDLTRGTPPDGRWTTPAKPQMLARSTVGPSRVSERRRPACRRGSSPSRFEGRTAVESGLFPMNCKARTDGRPGAAFLPSRSAFFFGDAE
ncbi:hypothetical protein CSOJ01_06606 [Colletotrichum sojae]|uniref:Uncharacterized protein n=1 Tax=Colletotrichum sojae TaxID=2175907 RepID=A0A8H6MUY1_9PEZI|nr:hypothetical protein CSOJ01_06606 [Colletotrichum sojae]